MKPRHLALYRGVKMNKLVISSDVENQAHVLIVVCEVASGDMAKLDKGQLGYKECPHGVQQTGCYIPPRCCGG